MQNNLVQFNSLSAKKKKKNYIVGHNNHIKNLRNPNQTWGEKLQQGGGVMHYHGKVDYFPITVHPDVFMSLAPQQCANKHNVKFIKEWNIIMKCF